MNDSVTVPGPFQLQTSLGLVFLWGRFGLPDRPLLLVVRGAIPEANQLVELVEAFPHLDVALVHLPGMHSPHMEGPSVARFAVAFDQLLAALGHRQVVVLGVSIGGAVALALRSPAVRARLLVDTPLTTDRVWPLAHFLSKHEGKSPKMDEWMANILGFRAGRFELRDYRSLLDALTAPARVLAGGIELEPPRDFRVLPSLVSVSDLAVYEAHPQVSVRMLPGVGHGVPEAGGATIIEELDRLFGTLGVEPPARTV